MIKFLDISNSSPYLRFIDLYEKAVASNQKAIEAVCISSFNRIEDEVDSRFVNLKYIQDNNWIFFTNYNSPKAEQFSNTNKISAIFYWQKINVQIRIKANIKKTNEKFSDDHFLTRSIEKNALAISSEQSMEIESFDKVINNYQKAMKSKDLLKIRPKNWGGFSFTPYSFEFWTGHKSRLNKREVFILEKNNQWSQKIIQP